METISQLFDQLGGTSTVGRLIGVAQSTASEMKRRGSIPIDHWPTIIASPKGREIGLTAEDMLRLHTHTDSPAPAPADLPASDSQEAI